MEYMEELIQEFFDKKRAEQDSLINKEIRGEE